MPTVQLLKFLLIGSFLLINNCKQSVSKPTVFTALKAVTAAQLIIPGKSIGQTKLNENVNLVFKRLGKPDSGDAAMGKSLSTWYADHDPKGYQTQIFCARNMGNSDENINRVKQIRVTSPGFKTKEGIGAGATLAQIQAKFKVVKTASYPTKKPPYQIYDDKKGIAFEILNDKCRAVIVYLPGDRGGITYLSF